MGPDLYFILIYNIPSRQLEIHEFEQDSVAAAEAYTLFEREHRDDRAVEVVLVGADSIGTIRKTHSHYFATQADDLFAQFLEDTGIHHIQGRVRKPRVRKRGDRKLST